MSKSLVLTGLVLTSMLAVACGKAAPESGGKGGDEASAAKGGSDADDSGTAGGMPSEAQMAKQTEETREALKKMNSGKDVKAVAAGDLKAALPEAISGMKRSNAEGSHQNFGGIDMSTFSADFDPEAAAEGEAEKPSFRVEVTDMGNVGATGAMGMAMWATMSYERETDTGYEKTTKYKGYPAIETYDREGKSGELQCVIGKRILAKVHGSNATIEQIRSAMDAVDVGKLESLTK